MGIFNIIVQTLALQVVRNSKSATHILRNGIATQQAGKTLMQHEALRGCMRLEPTNQIFGGLRPIRDPTRLCPQLARELRQLSVRTRSKCDLITRKWDLPMDKMRRVNAPGRLSRKSEHERLYLGAEWARV